MNTASPSYEQIATILEDHARARKLITYGDLCRELGMQPVNNLFRRSWLDKFFQQLDAWDSRDRKPFRTALVVLKRTGRPGRGFFNSLKLHREIKIASEQEDAVWQHERDSLFAYYDPSIEPTVACIKLTPVQKGRLQALADATGCSMEAVIERGLNSLLDATEDLHADVAEARQDAEQGHLLSTVEVFARLGLG